MSEHPRPSVSPASLNGAPGLAEHIHAIVVTYHPGRVQLSALLQAIVGQVETVIIVDNASPAEVRGWLEEVCESSGLSLKRLDRNMGVAAAHNVGVSRAQALGADAVVLFDQDSLPAENMVAQLREALRVLTRRGEQVAAVGPRHVDERTGKASPFVRFGFRSTEHLYCEGAGELLVDCDHLITSGTLIPIAVLDGVGGMEERLFIDGVDTEWCFRAMSKGYKLYGVCAAKMVHSVGEMPVTTWIPFSGSVIVHAPVRLYYMVRNHVLLYRRGYSPGGWVFQDFPRLLFKMGVFSTAIAPRLKNMSMMLRGLRDGIIGRTGPYGGGNGTASAYRQSELGKGVQK